MTTPLPDELTAAGITVVFAYPGFAVDDALAAIDDSEDLELVVTVSEAGAIAAAHGWWLMTGRPAAVVISDGAGIESAIAMIALAVRESAGILLIIPGLLPSAHASGPLMEAVGAIVMDYDTWNAGRSVECALDGHLVAVIPGWATTPSEPTSSPPHPTKHTAIVIGTKATATDLQIANDHNCPIVTMPGVIPPESLRSRWLGAITAGSRPEVFEVLGLGATASSGVLAAGCTHQLNGLLRAVHSDIESADISTSSSCESVQVTPEPTAPAGLPLFDTVYAVAHCLPDAILVADAGASHKVVAKVGHLRHQRAVCTFGPTTMGWGPGAGLGTYRATHSPVILSIGDGSLAISGLELLDWVRYGVRGVVVAAQNSTLGSVEARLGRGHRNVTACVLSAAHLFESIGIPWRAITAGQRPAPTAAWASAIAVAGGVAGVVVDTAGYEMAESRIPSGLQWWDSGPG